MDRVPIDLVRAFVQVVEALCACLPQRWHHDVTAHPSNCRHYDSFATFNIYADIQVGGVAPVLSSYWRQAAVRLGSEAPATALTIHCLASFSSPRRVNIR
jgi:hypothetical protein